MRAERPIFAGDRGTLSSGSVFTGPLRIPIVPRSPGAIGPDWFRTIPSRDRPRCNKNPKPKKEGNTVATKKEATASTELVGIEQVKAALLDRNVKLTIVQEDPEIAQRRIIEAIMDAKSVDDVWGSGQAVNAREIVDRPFRLVHATFHNSDYEEGSPIFVAMEVVFLGDGAGEAAIVVSGALGIVARVVKLVEFNALPIVVKVRSSKTNQGFNVYDLEPAPEAEPF